MEWGSVKKEIKDRQDKIRFLILILLLIVLTFGIGYLFGRYDAQKPLEITDDFSL